ncbi:MAG: leucine-rich repeat domain-containing protein [Oscillospiraceae bacterium]|nr:leucine-rich repeat domain-containing protein [Oscillospiraceae bacterium]
MKKIFAIVFALAAICFGATAHARIQGGICGANGSTSVRWELDSDTGVLRIYGDGAIADYDSYWDQPWNSMRVYSTVKEIQIDEGITRIGDCSFEFLNGSEKISLPSTLKEIGDAAFAHCYHLWDGETLTLPMGVEKIGRRAFQQVGMSSATLPTGLREIGSEAFYFVKLTSASLPEGLESIGENAFAYTHLTEIHIPEGCNVGKSAFAECRYLSSFTIPRSMTVIPDGLFKGANISSLIIPEWVIKIGAEAFFDTDITHLELPEGLRIIGREAFYSSTFLTHVSIPDSVTTIEDLAFAHCPFLTSVSMGKGVTQIGRFAFSSCGFDSIQLPEGLTDIYDGAFQGCGRLKSISLPQSVRNIGEMVFAESGITRINIPSNVTDLSPRVFYGAKYLEAIDVDPYNPVYVSHGGALYDKNLNLLFYPDGNKQKEFIPATGTVSIEADAVESNPYLETLVLPASVSSVGIDALRGFTGLKNIAAEGADMCSIDGVLYSGDGSALLCYPSGREDAEFSVPEGVLTIGKNAFMGSALVKISLPGSVRELGEGAFRNCEALEEVNLPNITELPKDLFRGCISITSLAVPEGVTAVNDSFGTPPYALELPQSLTVLNYTGRANVLTLPDNLTSVEGGSYSFMLYKKESVTGETIGDRLMAFPTVINNGEESTNVGRVLKQYTVKVSDTEIPVYRLLDGRTHNYAYALFVRESDLKSCGFSFEWDPEARTTTVILPEGVQWESPVSLPDGITDETETLDIWSSDIRFIRGGVAIPSINVGGGDSIIELNALADMKLY